MQTNTAWAKQNKTHRRGDFRSNNRDQEVRLKPSDHACETVVRTGCKSSSVDRQPDPTPDALPSDREYETPRSRQTECANYGDSAAMSETGKSLPHSS